MDSLRWSAALSKETWIAGHLEGKTLDEAWAKLAATSRRLLTKRGNLLLRPTTILPGLQMTTIIKVTRNDRLQCGDENDTSLSSSGDVSPPGEPVRAPFFADDLLASRSSIYSEQEASSFDDAAAHNNGDNRAGSSCSSHAPLVGDDDDDEERDAPPNLNNNTRSQRMIARQTRGDHNDRARAGSSCSSHAPLVGDDDDDEERDAPPNLNNNTRSQRMIARQTRSDHNDRARAGSSCSSHAPLVDDDDDDEERDVPPNLNNNTRSQRAARRRTRERRNWTPPGVGGTISVGSSAKATRAAWDSPAPRRPRPTVRFEPPPIRKVRRRILGRDASALGDAVADEYAASDDIPAEGWERVRGPEARTFRKNGFVAVELYKVGGARHVAGEVVALAVRVENPDLREVVTAESTLRHLGLAGLGIVENSVLDEVLATLQRLRSLDLSRNQLRHAPRRLPRSLVSLNLASNHLKSTSYLEHLANLQKLDLSKNELRSVSALHPLVLARSSLRELRVADNILCLAPAWRLALRDLLPKAVIVF